MRGLLVPQVATQELVAESDFYSYREMMRIASKREPSHWYVWTRRHHQDSVLPQANATLFANDLDEVGFYQRSAAIGGRLFELFNRMSGLYPVDFVMTSRAAAVASLMMGLAPEPSVPVPTLLTEPRVYSPGAVAHNTITEFDSMVRGVGYALAIGVYWSQWELDEALACMRLVCSPGLVDRARERAHVMPYIVKVREDRRPSETKRLLFAGRLNSNKGWDDVLAAYEKVVMSRSDVQAWVHSPTGLRPLEHQQDKKWLRSSSRLPDHADYEDLIASSDVAVYASKDEGVNATVLEMVASGVVVLLPERPWVDKLFDGRYPLTYVSLSDVPAMIDWCLDTLEERRAQLAPMVQLVKDRHSEGPWEEKWNEVIDHAMSERNAPEGLHRFRTEVVKQAPISFTAAVMESATLRIRKRKPNKARALSNYAAYEAVRDLDDHRNAEPYLEA